VSIQLDRLDFLLPVRVTYRIGDQTKHVFAYVDTTNKSVWMPGFDGQPECDDLAKLIKARWLGSYVEPPKPDLDLQVFNDFKAVSPPDWGSDERRDGKYEGGNPRRSGPAKA
jgi:hypothetical protein